MLITCFTHVNICGTQNGFVLLNKHTAYTVYTLCTFSLIASCGWHIAYCLLLRLLPGNNWCKVQEHTTSIQHSPMHYFTREKQQSTMHTSKCTSKVYIQCIHCTYNHPTELTYDDEPDGLTKKLRTAYYYSTNKVCIQFWQ